MVNGYLFFGFAAISILVFLGLFSTTSLWVENSTDIIVSFSPQGTVENVYSTNAKIGPISNASSVINFSPLNVTDSTYFSLQGVECQLSCAKKEQTED